MQKVKRGDKEKDGDVKRRQRTREHEGEEIRQAKIVEGGTEGSESAMESEGWRERGGPGGGAEHHLIVPWKSWAD